MLRMQRDVAEGGRVCLERREGGGRRRQQGAFDAESALATVGVVDASQVRTAPVEPERLYARAEVLSADDPVPRRPGVYGRCFSGLEGVVPLEDCREVAGRFLLYVGIAPSRAGSRATLRSRLRQHCRGNASGSTLRRTLGSVLADGLGIQRRQLGTRTLFAQGEFGSQV